MIPHTWNIRKIPRAVDLELGSSLPELCVAYETWGQPSAARDNVVVVLHALSGSSHAAASDGVPGWWDGLLEAGAPLGQDRHFIVCPNLLGGCYGSTGPRSVNPDTGKIWATDFPQITIADMVQAVRLLLDDLDLGPEHAAPLTLVGGSMGGMLVLEWAALYPDEVGSGIALGTPGRTFPQTTAFRSVQRSAIMADPAWKGGFYDPAEPPATGLSLARQIGMITYRSDTEFTERFGREVRDDRPHFTEGMYEVESYIRYQGRKFAQRFDANSYLYYSRAMDFYDLGAGQASFEAGLRRIRSPLLLIAFSTDFLCPPSQTEEVHRVLADAGRPARYVVVSTTHGHDAFLIEIESINRAIAERPHR